MPDKTAESIDDILDIATDSGVLILQNGGETYRAEDTMTAVARSLGARSSSAFVTPTVVMLTCTDHSGISHTRIQRINDRTINLGKIARVNELSRRLAASGQKADLGSTEAILRRISSSPSHSRHSVIFATAVASFCFSLLFSGSMAEAAAAALIGAVMRTVLFIALPLGFTGFLLSITGAAVISLLSGAAVALGLVPSSGNINISVLMSLVPGLAIVNAIRDIIAGDLVAGSARTLEAFIIAAALSLGASVGLFVFAADASWIPSLLSVAHPVAVFALAFGATASFAFFFQISRYDILWAALFGAVGWLVFLYVSGRTGSIVTGYMCGALSVGACAECAAVLFRKPATVYIVPGIIPLVPGGGMYETMLMAVLGRGEQALSIGFSTLTAAAAIAVGIALASSIARLLSRIRKVRQLRSSK
jgi:uncharacterized membrane protein YjjP (DUF1212 family)